MEEKGYAIVRKVEGGHVRVIQLVRRKLVLIEKVRFFPDAAIGLPYGTILEVKNKELYVVEGGTEMEEEEEKPDSFPSIPATSQLNQNLSAECIVQMREEGRGGEEIVSRLVEGSSSFSQKTTFAQDKYLKRKRRKHGDRILFLRPSVRLVADIYYRKDTSKCCSLRMDLLAHILTMSNVQSGSRVLVMEQTQGVLTSALLQRLSGRGMCVHLHKGSVPQGVPCIEIMGFSPEEMDVFYPVPLSFLFETNQPQEDEKIRKLLEWSAGGTREGAGGEERDAKRETKRLRMERGMGAIGEGGLDSLLLVLQHTHPLPLLQTLLSAILPSSPFVVYSPYLESVVECYNYLRTKECAVGLRLSDSFFREHQILPERTHPEMSQLISGGFILCGTSVISNQ